MMFSTGQSSSAAICFEAAAHTFSISMLWSAPTNAVRAAPLLRTIAGRQRFSCAYLPEGGLAGSAAGVMSMRAAPTRRLGGVDGGLADTRSASIAVAQKTVFPRYISHPPSTDNSLRLRTAGRRGRPQVQAR